MTWADMSEETIAAIAPQAQGRDARVGNTISAATGGPQLEPEATSHESPIAYGAAGAELVAFREGRLSGWELPLDDELRRSFVAYRRSHFPESQLQNWYKNLEQRIKWSQLKVGPKTLPRSAAWLTNPGCSCSYRYIGTLWPSTPMEPWFRAITDAVCKACDVKEPPNSCNANLYEDGSQAVGWHADDERLFDAVNRDTLIISLSLGATRSFELQPKDNPGQITRLQLSDGDICTMEGLCQKHYVHRVPQESDVGKARINLTWRWIVRHDKACACCPARPWSRPRTMHAGRGTIPAQPGPQHLPRPDDIQEEPEEDEPGGDKSEPPARAAVTAGPLGIRVTRITRIALAVDTHFANDVPIADRYVREDV